MTSISEARTAAAEVVDGHAYMPSRFTAPGWVISPGSPYITRESYGTYTIRLDATYVTKAGTVDVVGEDLDEVLDEALTDFLNSGWTVEEGGEPVSLEINGAAFSGFVLTITNTI